MGRLTMEYRDEGERRRVVLVGVDPTAEGEIERLGRHCADLVAGLSDRQFAAAIEEARRRGLAFGPDGLKPASS